MQIAIICEIKEKNPIGIIGKNKDNIGFITNSRELDEILDYIIDKDDINLLYNETISNDILIRNQNFNIKSETYFIGLNYILSEKWKILGLTEYEEENDFESDLQIIFNMLVEEALKYEN